MTKLIETELSTELTQLTDQHIFVQKEHLPKASLVACSGNILLNTALNFRKIEKAAFPNTS